MKKLFSLLSLIILFSVAASASNTKPIANNNNLADQKQVKTKTEKNEKYDFSLFKFITPSTKSEGDTLKESIDKPRKKAEFNDETTELYESPRCFLMFS